MNEWRRASGSRLLCICIGQWLLCACFRCLLSLPARPALGFALTCPYIPCTFMPAAQRVAILAQKAHIERQELQLRLQRLKRSLSTAAAAAAGQAAAAAGQAAAAGAASPAAAFQHDQQLAGTATGSLIVAAQRRLDKPVHVE